MRIKDLETLFNNGIVFDNVVTYHNIKFTKIDGEFVLCKYDDVGEEEVVIPSAFSIISQEAFRDNHTLRRIKFSRGVKRIADSAFYNCSELEEIILPNTLEDISDCAFENCVKLKAVIQNGSKPLSIGSRAFSGCKRIDKIQCNNLYFLGTSSFENCIALKRVSIPNVTNYLGRDIFKGCTALRFADVRGIESIGPGWFSNCERLEEIWIQAYGAFYTIGFGAFSGCTNLRKVVLYQSREKLIVTQEGDNEPYKKAKVFMHYTDTGEEVEAICVSNKEKSIGNYRVPRNIDVETIYKKHTLRNFRDIGNKVVDINSVFTTVGSEAFKGNTTIEKLNIQNGVQNINTEAFCDCTALSEVTFPVTIQQIASDAFRGTNIKDVNINSEVGVLVSNRAFANCKNLKKVKISNLIYMGKGLFEGCMRLRDIILETDKSKNRGFTGGLGNLRLNRLTLLNFGAISDAALQNTIVKELVISDSTKAIGRNNFTGSHIKGVIYVTESDKPEELIKAIKLDNNADLLSTKWYVWNPKTNKKKEIEIQKVRR